MKKLIIIGLSFFILVKLSGQTQGISYQAVIIDKTPQEVPGKDITGNIMPNHPVKIRFSILDAAGTIEFQEEHSTTTDMYGMINLVIGKGIQTSISPNVFSGIDWDGSQKSLKVDLSLSETDVFYTDFSYEDLTFVPYAYHRNITATGSLAVDGMTTLKSRVDVTDGSPTFLTGNLTVDELTTLNNNLTVNATSDLKGQVTINPDFSAPGDKKSYEAYPLRVEGSNQGIAVKIDGTRSSNNYFVTFMDQENIQGRIEGQTTAELLVDPEYIFDNVLFANEVIRSTVDVAKAVAGVVSASSSSTVCAGLGACVTAPVPSLIAGAVAEVVMETANLALVTAEPIMYNVFKHTNIGVSYQSGAGDYAEWLPKFNPAEKFLPGDIVGVKGGYITKNTGDAEHFMIISRNPIVLGNMPEEGKESEYEKVAFLGQVPVKVSGKVKSGDFIIPDGKNNGSGVAVSRDEIQAGQVGKIVGVAWSASESSQYTYINALTGLNFNYIARLNEKQEQKIRELETEINILKEQLNSMNSALSLLIPDYSVTMQGSKPKGDSSAVAAMDVFPREVKTVVYYELTKDNILEGLDLAEKTLREKGVDLSTHPFFKRISTDPEYKECFINDALASVKKELDKHSQDDMKSGARVIRINQDIR